MVVCNSTTVPPDGVRYTRQMRDGYMYRAMLKHIEKALQMVGQIRNRRTSSEVLSANFSGMVRQATLPYTNAGFSLNLNLYRVSLQTVVPQPAYIFSVLGETEYGNENHRYVPIPVKDYASIGKLLNARNFQRSDAFAVHSRDLTNWPVLEIYSQDMTLFGANNVVVTYLPYPVDPALQSTNVSRLTETLGLFQLSMIGSVIGLATLYAKMDDQESGSLEQFASQLTEIGVGYNSNVGGNPAQ